MEISKLFNEEIIFIDQSFKTKDEALKFIAKNLKDKSYATDEKILYDEFNKREEQVSTGLGDKIAIPHLRSDVVLKNAIVFLKIKPLDWKALDDQKVEYIFAIATTTKDQKDNLHLLALQKLATLFLNNDFKKGLENIQDPKSFLALLAKFNKEEESLPMESDPSKKFVLAITSCPTGIAHTYIAAAKLKEVAKEMGVEIKVETQGANGIENKISQSDIDRAEGLIIAVDRSIETARFKNMTNVIETSTGKAIKASNKLIQDVLDKKGEKLKNITGSSENGENSSTQGEEYTFANFGKKSYKAVLTGISYMLPFVVFGGIMIAISFLIDSFAGSPGNGSFGTTNIVANWFNAIGGTAFSVFVAILAAYITFAIVGRVGLLPGFVVGFMSSGQINSLYFRIFGIDLFSNFSSGFFGAIAGAFISAAIIIVLMKYVLHKFPQSLQGIKQIIIVPFFGTLIIASVFFVVNIPLLYVNFGFNEFLKIMNGRAELVWLLGLITGIMMGTDLGGPVNKAAYIFAVSTLTAANGTPQVSIVMASVMAAGMVPPITIALSALITKKVWTKEERIEAQANWLFGFSFISEGAIPITAKYPKRMIPANIASAGITGMIAALFGITIQAPHGGIFVAPLLSTTLISGLNVGLTIFIAFLLWMLAIFIGAFVGVLVIWGMHNLELKNKGKPKKSFSKMTFWRKKSNSNKVKVKINYEDIKLHSLKEIFKTKKLNL